MTELPAEFDKCITEMTDDERARYIAYINETVAAYQRRPSATEMDEAVRAASGSGASDA